MTRLYGSCSRCEKVIEWEAPVGSYDMAVGDEMDAISAQVFQNHSVVCGGCGNVNRLVVDKVRLKIFK